VVEVRPGWAPDSGTQILQISATLVVTASDSNISGAPSNTVDQYHHHCHPYTDSVACATQEPPPRSAMPTVDQKLDEINAFIRQKGFSSVANVLLAELSSTNRLRSQESQEFFDGGGFTCFVETCLKNRRAKRLCGNAAFIATIAPLVSASIANETAALCRVLARPLDTYSPRDIAEFDFNKITQTIQTTAPIFWSVVATVVPVGTDVYEMDSDEGGNPETASQKKSKCHRGRNKPLMMTFAISLLCYARTKNANLIPGQMGYFLVATGTGKRTIDVLHRVGVSICYESILRVQKAIANGARLEYSEKAKRLPCILSYDNMNYMASVKTLLLHKKGHLQSDTAAYIYFLRNSETYGGLLPKTWVHRDPEAVRALQAFDLMPQNLQYYREAAGATLYRLLCKHFEPQMQRSRKKFQLDPITVHPINELHPVQSDIYTLPTLDLNEAKIDETIEILKTLHKELDLPLEALNDRVLMVKGDWLTVRNINSALFQRQEAVNDEETFDWIEPVMGLFHLQMNVLKLLIGTHWGRMDGKDVASLQRFVKMVGNNRVKKDSKDFRGCLNFVNDVLDGHILAAMVTASGVKDLEALGNRIETSDWRAMIDNITNLVSQTQRL
jgi:hypothetical protein